MKVTENAIKSVGLTILYEPEEPTDAVVDIVLVHGIGGHPVRSWKRAQVQDRSPTIPSVSVATPTSARSFKKLQKKNNNNKNSKGSNSMPLRRANSEPMLGRKQDSSGRGRNVLKKKNSFKSSSSRLGLGSEAGEDGSRLAGGKTQAEVYWPLDLLPASCPNARILVWGHLTLVVNGKPLRLQDNVFSHAKDLLRELAGTRDDTNTAFRPIIFVAHSTGGTLVKEILRLSESEDDGPLQQILLSTTATVFIASPHRDSENSRLGDAVRSMASVTMGVDPDDAVLQELTGAASLELELGRGDFIRLWNDYNFKVKTYQESMVNSTSNVVPSDTRADAFIRRRASFLGNPRECAETIHANHADICKFDGPDDGGYRSLVNTLLGYISTEAGRSDGINDEELGCFTALSQPQCQGHQTHLTARIYPGTCLWLYDMPQFQAWHHRSDGNRNRILWLKGTSGSGKSVLLHSLRERIEKEWGPAGGSIIWAAVKAEDTGGILDPSPCGDRTDCAEPCGVYRALLAQLFPQDASLRKALMSLYERYKPAPPALNHVQIATFFVDKYIQEKIEVPARRTFILIDVSDSCGPAYLKKLLPSLSRLAQNSDFSICVASGKLLSDEAAGGNVLDIMMHPQNSGDILRYASHNLLADWKGREKTVARIGRKAGGVFLWAEIAVNIINAAIDEGASQELIEYTLEEMPEDLHGLYEWMLGTLNDREKEEALILFQWVILSAEPMRLNDLLVAVRLTAIWPTSGFTPGMALRLGTPLCMRDLPKIRNSEVTSDKPFQFHSWIRSRSVGLLEMRSDNQGGFVNEPWGLQCVQATHDSVRSFFLSGRGFACLYPHPSPPPPWPAEEYIDRAHYSMLHACLLCLNMKDFENLGRAGFTSQASLSREDSQQWRRIAFDQRNLIVSCYPFLRYAVRNLLFHMLAPLQFRYFLPQKEVLRLFSANRCRLWRRWTALLGGTPDPVAILAMHDEGPAARVLSPVFGSRFRLERVFRRLARTTAEREKRAREDVAGGSGGTGGGKRNTSTSKLRAWPSRGRLYDGKLSPASQPRPSNPLADALYDPEDVGALGLAV